MLLYFSLKLDIDSANIIISFNVYIFNHFSIFMMKLNNGSMNQRIKI